MHFHQILKIIARELCIMLSYQSFTLLYIHKYIWFLISIFVLFSLFSQLCLAVVDLFWTFIQKHLVFVIFILSTLFLFSFYLVYNLFSSSTCFYFFFFFFFYSLTFSYFLLLWLLLPNNFPPPLSKHPVTLPAEFSIHNPFTFSGTNHRPSHPSYYFQILEISTYFPPLLSIIPLFSVASPSMQVIHSLLSISVL